MGVDGFEQTRFEHEGVARTVFRRGHGPGVVVMHEIPGITPEVASFARSVADAGFTVVIRTSSARPASASPPTRSASASVSRPCGESWASASRRSKSTPRPATLAASGAPPTAS